MSTQSNAHTAIAERQRRVADLYESYSPHIASYAGRRASSCDASDVVAETFLTAWRRVDDIPEEPHALPWLYGVARRVLANQRRGNQRRTQLHDRLAWEVPRAQVDTTRLEVADDFSRVSKAINELSDADAELIRLTAWDGLSPSELADSMGIEPNAARQRLHRARRRLAMAVAMVLAVGISVVILTSGVLTNSDVVETEFHDDSPAFEAVPTPEAGATKVISGEHEVGEVDDDAAPNATTSLPAQPPATVTTPETPTADPSVDPSAGSADTEQSAPVAAITPLAPATTVAPPATTTAAPITTTDGPFAIGQDLLAVHFDFAHLDDGHATVATAEVALDFGITPSVVAGTQSPASASFVHDYQRVMNETFGSGWRDAGSDWGSAINAAANEWLAVFDRGGRVWVAEGGVSDFTAEVLSEIVARRPNLDTVPLVRVVQHAQRNENETVAEALALVTSHATYTRIDDGNQSNGTADLELQSQTFETAALGGPFASAWTVAFDAMSADQLDFSDTVAVLDIFEIAIDQVANPDDFVEVFIG